MLNTAQLQALHINVEFFQNSNFSLHVFEHVKKAKVIIERKLSMYKYFVPCTMNNDFGTG